MSPLDYIKEGILKGNWETVCEGYERLTGDALPLPRTITNRTNAEEALQQISDIVSELQTISEEQVTKPAKKIQGRPKGSKKKKTKKNTEVNSDRYLVDKDGEDSSILLDEKKKTVVQKKVGTTQFITNDPDPAEVEANKVRAEKTGRNKLKYKRKPITTYEVECNECLQPFQSTRQKGEMGQKCPKCLGGLKSRFTQ